MRCRKGGQTNAETPAKAGAFFAGAFGAAVLSDGGGAAVGGGCAAHQRPAAPALPGAELAPHPAGGRGAVQRDDGPHQQPQRHSVRGHRCPAHPHRKAGGRAALLHGLSHLPHGQPHRAGCAGPPCPARRPDRPCRHGPDHHPRHSGDGHRRGGRRPAGLCGGVHFQPQL